MSEFTELLIIEVQNRSILWNMKDKKEHMFKIISECMERRGVQTTSVKIDDIRVMLKFELPLNEIIVDFHDSLKSLTSGFASFDYEDLGYASSPLVKLDILLNGVMVDALSTIAHATKATTLGKRMCAKLVEIVPRQMVHIAIQAVVGSKVVARENIKAFRKDVTAKLYGGDVTRRQKLLKQQAIGKKRMKSVANINIPRDTFIDVLKR